MACIESSFEVNSTVSGEFDIEQITGDVVPIEAANTIVAQQETIDKQAERIEELENSPYQKAVTDTYAVAAGMSATMPAEQTPENLAATVATIPYSPTRWQRPTEWPNYNYVDKTSEEAIYLTYDTAGEANFASFYLQGSNLAVTRGYIDADGYHAQTAPVTVRTSQCFTETLPTDNGRYVVYKITGTIQIFNFANSDGTNYSGSGDGISQACVEQYGYMPNATRIASSYNFGYCAFCCQNTVNCAIEVHASTATTVLYLFSNGDSLVNVDLSGWQLPNVGSLASVFNNKALLKFVIGFGSVATANINNLKNCFSGDVSLRYIDFNGADLSGVTSDTNLFSDCVALSGLIDLSTMTSISALWGTFKGANMNGTIVLPDKENLEGSSNLSYWPFYGFYSGTIEVLGGVKTISANIFSGIKGNGEAVVINIHNDEGAIEGAPWGATNATINYLGKD